MERHLKHFNYSLKNIPTPSKKQYLACLIEKVESFIRRLRWKAFFFEKQNAAEDDTGTGTTGTNNETFGFKSSHSPPQNEALNSFEDDLYNLVRSIEFVPVQNAFLNSLNKDVREINNSEKVWVFADKTTNIYCVDKDMYTQTLRENVTKSYKRCNEKTTKLINKEAKMIARNLKLDDKMQRYATRKAFVTFKDHKINFNNNVKCRLINPAKSEVGLVSKKILQNINAVVRESTGLLQWRNTEAVISWFKGIPNKEKCKFLSFDVVDFYPSITEALLDNSIMFASSMTAITPDEIAIIKHARKSILFDNDGAWTRKGRKEGFDITMGSYDGAECCEMVGLYLLSQIATVFGKENIGLYRDDGLAVLPDKSGPQAEKARKDLIRIFKDNNLSITADANIQNTNFLDVTFDLKNKIYYPYRKPNNVPLYINTNSNHPPTILKQLPIMINQRISNISCNEKEFDIAKPMYEKALDSSGHKISMKFSPPTNTGKINRKRNIIWFNPPFSRNVKTNIGKIFINLIRKHFPPYHKFRSIFNKNNLKISYSCMPNMRNIIKNHNSKILNTNNEETLPSLCNCRNIELCPLNGQCRQTNVIYKATVSSGSVVKSYYGLSKGEFKLRYRNHTSSFRNKKYSKSSELAKYIWHLKDRNKQYEVAWSVVSRANACRCGTRRCNLCTTEKLLIAQSDPLTTLNKRSEIISKCRHENKFYLKNVK